MSNHLELLKSMTTVVSDTGDIGSIERYKPQDATTNPSLILKAATLDAYTSLVDQAVSFAMAHSNQAKERLKLAGQKLAVNFGCAILKIIPGRVSTEVDARLSFDIQASCQQARELVALYKQEGVDASRVLIKLASTWEGIEAAKILEKEGIHCNLTLMFNLAQAVACAQSGVFLISPFVGRIYDWYKAHENRDYTQEEDPGVQSVKTIYDYLRKFNYPTIVMGASFRNVGQIIELAGCDYLTISPSLLEELQRTPGNLKRVLTPQLAQTSSIEKLSIDEKRFRWMMNDDPMATEKLAEGIRIFAKDIYKMEKELLLPRLE